MREVEENTARVRCDLQNRSQEMPLATANVCDRSETREVVSPNDLGYIFARPCRHRSVEQRALLRMCRQVGEDALRGGKFWGRPAAAKRMTQTLQNSKGQV